jgi:hypothetical protein
MMAAAPSGPPQNKKPHRGMELVLANNRRLCKKVLPSSAFFLKKQKI